LVGDFRWLDAWGADLCPINRTLVYKLVSRGDFYDSKQTVAGVVVTLGNNDRKTEFNCNELVEGLIKIVRNTC